MGHHVDLCLIPGNQVTIVPNELTFLNGHCELLQKRSGKVCYAAGPKILRAEVALSSAAIGEGAPLGIQLNWRLYPTIATPKLPIFRFYGTRDQTHQNGCTTQPDGYENLAK